MRLFLTRRALLQISLASLGAGYAAGVQAAVDAQEAPAELASTLPDRRSQLLLLFSRARN